MARNAERGKFDFYFIGDQLIGLPEWQYERPNQVLRPEALSFAGYIAGVTDKIGIVATVNTTYADPFTVARATATLDHLSKGRLGWNVVTGEAEAAAANYGPQGTLEQRAPLRMGDGIHRCRHQALG